MFQFTTKSVRRSSSFRSVGSLFHARGAATEKALLPISQHVRGMTRLLHDEAWSVISVNVARSTHPGSHPLTLSFVDSLLRERMSCCFYTCHYIHVSRRRCKMYSGHGYLCVCLSVHGCMPSAHATARTWM